MRRSSLALAVVFVTGACAADSTMPASPPTAATLRQPSQPFPRNDGLLYPGDSGTEAMGEYYRQWGEHISTLPPREDGRPAALQSFTWMVGRWQAIARDYEADAAKGRGMSETGSGPATISFTPDQRWLRIESELRPNWFNARYIGFDRAARHYVLQEITGPGVVYVTPVTSRGWAADRIVFGPANLLYYGLAQTGRITLIRNSADQFRIVYEGQLSDGTFMAMDDVVYTRVAQGR